MRLSGGVLKERETKEQEDRKAKRAKQETNNRRIDELRAEQETTNRKTDKLRQQNNRKTTEREKG